MRVQYNGTSNFQEFSKADFDKAGVEGKKVSFPRGEAVEVPDEVGQVLVSKDDPIFGDFEFSEVEDDAEPRGANEPMTDASDEGGGESAGGGPVTTGGSRGRTGRGTTRTSTT